MKFDNLKDAEELITLLGVIGGYEFDLVEHAYNEVLVDQFGKLKYAVYYTDYELIVTKGGNDCA